MPEALPVQINTPHQRGVVWPNCRCFRCWQSEDIKEQSEALRAERIKTISKCKHCRAGKGNPGTKSEIEVGAQYCDKHRPEAYRKRIN